MKNALIHVLFLLFEIFVSAAPVKTVSVMVGDSVTLHTGITEPQIYDVLQWRFKNSLIAEINRKIGKFFTSNTDERFKGRLQLDYWSGSLTIRNIENKHSGVYEVDIISSHLTIHTSFTVTVSGEMKSVLSVMEGESVTLNSDLTDIQTDDLVWMLGDSQIAGISKAGDPFYTSDGPIDRLKLDNQTGSLTITDTTHTDSGEYTLKIIISRSTIIRRFTVSVSVTVTVTVIDPGLSAGAKAAIGIGVLLVCAAAVAGVRFYYRRKLSELAFFSCCMVGSDKGRILSVMEGEHLSLNPDGVHKDDKLVWTFRSSCIAVRESGAHRFTVHDDLPDGRFKAESDSEPRLDLDPQTGSLSIPKTRTTDTGEYELLIIRSGKSSTKRFRVSVFVKTADMKPVPVNEGDSVTLPTDVADAQEVDEIQWKFGLDTPLAVVRRGEGERISPILEVRLDLDHQTRSLIIKKIRPTDAGIYMLYINEGGKITAKLFRVSVSANTPEEHEQEQIESSVGLQSLTSYATNTN